MRAVKFWFRKYRLRAKWRRRSKRSGGIRLRIGNVMIFLRRLEEAGISYVVLRWPEELPLYAFEEAGFQEDVDLLVDLDMLDSMASLAAEHHGRIPVDLYSVSGRKGANYLKMPYFPPAFALEVLASRVRHPNGFFIPNKSMYFWSLAYHLVYHKGQEAGIPSGCGLKVDCRPKREYGLLLRKLGADAGICIPNNYTLINLHNMLEKMHLNMSFDLLVRWPKQTPWHHFLMKSMREHIAVWAEKLPDLAVFFIREELADEKNEGLIVSLLAMKFKLIEVIHLDESQQYRVRMQVRGGNWISLTTKRDSPPRVAIICYDLNPKPFRKNDKLADSYPHMRNRNMLYKLEVRNALHLADGRQRLNALHGSDNALEAQHMLAALVGHDSLEQKNLEILTALEGNYSHA